MKCSFCRTNEATIHIRNDVNGVVTEMHVCPGCAQKKGMLQANTGEVPNPFIMDAPFEIAAHPENLIAQLMKQFPPMGEKSGSGVNPAVGTPGANGGPPPGTTPNTKTSPLDGLSGEALEAMDHLTRTGRFRSADDYMLLEGFLGPMLQEIQAGRQHRGKAPAAAHIPQQTHLRELKQLLTNAIASEDYEQAAALRDQIHALEHRKPSSVGGKK